MTTKSARRRSREFALQGLNSWLLSGCGEGDLASQFADARGFDKCDKPFFLSLLQGTTQSAAELEALLQPLLDRKVQSLSPVERAELEQFGTAFEAGMDPYEVGTKILRGMERGDGLILTHPEFAEDFRAIYEASLAALPDEEAPPERLAIENLRRAANAAAAAGTVIGLGDLT